MPFTFLPVGPLGPPAIQEVYVTMKCPDGEKPLNASIQLVQEGVAWQQDVTSKEFWEEVTIFPVTPSSSLKNLDLDSPLERFPRRSKLMRGLSRTDLEKLKAVDRIADNILNLALTTLQINGKAYLIADAGSQYPQVWVRDMATIQSGLIDRGWNLSENEGHWVDLFLSEQSPSGEIPDWIVPFPQKYGVAVGKNTIQSDQELWLIAAALEAVANEVVPKQWLNESINGLSRLKRLLLALGWVINNRWHRGFDCLWSGHIADWGDVGLTGFDEQTSTKFEHGTPQVCGIFLQSLMWHVASQLEQVVGANQTNALLKPYNATLLYLKNGVKDFANRKLWDEVRGQFKIHAHLDDFYHDFDEAEIFALGGNYFAAFYGLASFEQSDRIINRTLILNKRYSLPTIGFVLIPPYPDATYQNPIMNREYTYQNGGDWDWFGIRMADLIMQKYPQHGQLERLRIADKVISNGTFYEWTRLDTRPGAGANFRAGASVW